MEQSFVRCISHLVKGFLLGLSKIDGLIFSFISLFETGTYDQASLNFMLPLEVPGVPGPSRKRAAIFMGGFVYYGPKSICPS
jgi:hypothetical protein